MWRKRKRKLTRRKSVTADDECASPVDPLRALIDDLRVFLMHVIDLRNGLIDVLRNKGVLSVEQVEVIRSRPTETSEISLLLDYAVSLSGAGRKECLDALNETRQTHVANYLRARGSREATHGDDWPVLHDKSWEAVGQNWHRLIELVDTRCGLLDELLSVGCINDRHRESVMAEKTNSAKNDCLLSIMRRRSISDFKNFIQCLLKTKQHRVASLLSSPGSTAASKVICDEHMSRLRKNHSALVDLVDVNPDLLARLRARDCITRRQGEFIDSAPCPSEKAGRLLDVVRRGCESDLKNFVDCLREAGQEHVCRVLIENGVVALTVATISGLENVEQCEDMIVKQFMRYFTNCCSERKKQLLSSLLSRHVHELGSADVELIGAKKGHSIGLYYFVKSSSGLRHLCRQYSEGRLVSIVRQLFCAMLTDSESSSLCVDTLRWSESNYVSCMLYFGGFSPSSKLSTIYQLAPVNSLFPADCRSCHVRVERFPVELVEMVLLKAAGRLFVAFSKLIPDAGACAATALSAVVSSWWDLILHRRHNRRVIKRYFKRACFPFKCRPQKLARLQMDTVEHVRSMTEFDGKLYITCFLSDTIQVLVSRPPFSRLGGIRVRGMQTPVDCVVCADSSRLYIADDGSCYTIWRVNLLCDAKVNRFITLKWPPFSMSIISRRLLIVPHDGDALFLYSDDGSQLCHIELPQYMDALHAVETMHSTYVVSHCYRTTEDTQSAIQQCK
jgi:hypothetical protein